MKQHSNAAFKPEINANNGKTSGLQANSSRENSELFKSMEYVEDNSKA
jgi:hypothetical protein